MRTQIPSKLILVSLFMIGLAAPAYAGSSTRTPTVAIELNRSSEATLRSLPGIGAVLAHRIAEHRTQHPFRSTAELRNVHGIGKKLYQRIQPWVFVSAPATGRAPREPLRSTSEPASRTERGAAAAPGRAKAPRAPAAGAAPGG